MANFICRVILLAALATVSHQGEAGQEAGVDININVLYKPDVCNREAKAGDYVTVTYVAFLPSETGNEQFDTSDNTGPVHFKLHDPTSTAMQGWHHAVEGMCQREKREVVIPAGELTMNHRLPNTKIPPQGKDLGYRFELRDIKDSPPVENLFKKMDLDDNKEITREEIKEFISNSGLGGIDKFEDHEDAINQMFKQMDKDENGAISHEEFPGPKHDEF